MRYHAKKILFFLGKFSAAKQFLNDAIIVAKNKHMIQYMDSQSYSKFKLLSYGSSHLVEYFAGPFVHSSSNLSLINHTYAIGIFLLLPASYIYSREISCFPTFLLSLLPTSSLVCHYCIHYHASLTAVIFYL